MTGASVPSALATVRAPHELRRVVDDWRRAGLRIALVPTMGALHEGHLSLVRAARANADRVMASLFVNPTQFAEGEDLTTYPRDEDRDARLLAAEGCDLLFAPAAEDVYPQGFATDVVVGGPAQGLESAARPHFFRGVATVVTKLLTLCAPDAAVFGEKDYQQLLVIRRLVADLNLPVEVLSAPTVREEDGLAMSSRNAYLRADARRVAGRLNVILRASADTLMAGADPAGEEERAAKALLAAGFDDVDYVAVRDANTLAALRSGPLQAPARVLAAARVAGVRLIDNVPAPPAA